MGLADIIRNGVKTVERVAGELRVPVVHYPVTGRDAYGPSYGPGVDREALVEYIVEDVAEEAVSRAKLTFLEPIAVHERDRFDIPDSRGGIITLNVQAVNAPMDPTGALYFAEVLLGD
jgi:hypothetical protein